MQDIYIMVLRQSTVNLRNACVVVLVHQSTIYYFITDSYIKQQARDNFIV